KIPGTAQRVRSALVEVSHCALADLQAVRLSVHHATASFAANRRPAGEMTDNDVPILKIAAPDGQLRAVVFGYACHNLTIPPEDYRYYADWAGLAQEQIETKHSGATALFLTG